MKNSFLDCDGLEVHIGDFILYRHPREICEVKYHENRGGIYVDSKNQTIYLGNGQEHDIKKISKFYIDNIVQKTREKIISIQSELSLSRDEVFYFKGLNGCYYNDFFEELDNTIAKLRNLNDKLVECDVEYYMMEANE